MITTPHTTTSACHKGLCDQCFADDIVKAHLKKFGIEVFVNPDHIGPDSSVFQCLPVKVYEPGVFRAEGLDPKRYRRAVIILLEDES